MNGLSPHLRKSAPWEDSWRGKRYREITVSVRADSKCPNRGGARSGNDNDDNGCMKMIMA